MTGSEWYSTSRGGLTRYFSGLYGALAERDDVTVTAAAFGDPDSGGTSWGPATGGTRSRVALSRQQGAEPVDILDRHFALYGPPPRHAALVTHFHGPWAAESAAAGESRLAVAAKAAIERLRYRRSAHAIVLSQQFADVLADDYGFAAERISVIPPGVDLTRFTASAVTHPARVLCVRRLERRMGLDILLDAWPAVVAAIPAAQLEIVGTGTLEQELRARVGGSALAASVTLRGEVSDAELEAAYRDSTITVIPTRSLEGFGLITLESLASGRAPVVTDVGGLPDSVRGLAPDLIVPPEDSAALAARIVAALDGDRPSPEAARAHAETFTWQRCAARHVELYRSLLPNSQLPGSGQPDSQLPGSDGES